MAAGRCDRSERVSFLRHFAIRSVDSISCGQVYEMVMVDFDYTTHLKIVHFSVNSFFYYTRIWMIFT